MERYKLQQLPDKTKTVTKTAEITDPIKLMHNTNFVDLCSDEEDSTENHCNNNNNEICYTITDSDDDNDDHVNDEDDVIIVDHVNSEILANQANFNNKNGHGAVTIALRPCSYIRQQNQNAVKVNVDKNRKDQQPVRTVSSHPGGPLQDRSNDNERTAEVTNDVYSKLFSILEEYEPQIKDVWRRHNQAANNPKRKMLDSTNTNPTNDNLFSQPKAKQIRLSNNAKHTANEQNSKKSETSQHLCTNASAKSIGSITASTNRRNVEEDVGEQEEENANDINNILIRARSEIIEEPKFTKRALTNYNNDCQMTAMDTVVCALCPSKPKDLTSHYIRRHKTESYISRLPWFKLNNLLNKTNYVHLIECVYGNDQQNRYSVTCPFCNHIVTERFQDFYEHFSMHTGEYAYGCEVCNFRKPFACDIKNHQNQSKLCQMSNIKILYRYSPMARNILLHFCFICNFVQLNEANIAKHLRDHHNDDENLPGNIRHCILVSLPQP